MAKKKPWWDSMWDSLWLLLVLESLLVPWNSLQARPPSKVHELLGDSVVSEVARTLYPTNGLQAYILTDVLDSPSGSFPSTRRPAASPEGTSSAFNQRPSTSAYSEDLSLVDYDLIDILWRRDIDQEKGVLPFAPSPELEHEHDLHLLSEKHFSQQLPSAWSDEREELYKSLSKAYEDLRASQRQWQTGELRAERWPDKEESTVEILEGDEKVFPQYRLDPLLEQSGGASAASWKEDLNLEERACFDEFFKSIDDGSSVPESDVFLGTGNNSPVLSQAPTLESPPLRDNRNIEDFVGAGEEQLEVFPPLQDLDSIPTPALDLSPSDVTRLFTDRQVTADVASFSHPVPASPDLLTDGWMQRRRTESLDFFDQPLEFESPSEVTVEMFPPLERAEFPKKDEFPLQTPTAASRLPTPEFVPAMDLAHISHDHLYTASDAAPFFDSDPAPFSSSPQRHHEDGDGIGRLHGKLVPKVEPELIKEEEEEEEEGIDVTKLETEQRKRKSGRKSQDEGLAAMGGLPFSAQQIVDMTLHKYQQTLKSRHFSSAQIELIKKIRRRGKNKVAAQNCRKRKATGLEQLEVETSLLEQEKMVETQTRQQLLDAIKDEEQRIIQLQRKLSANRR